MTFLVASPTTTRVTPFLRRYNTTCRIFRLLLIHHERQRGSEEKAYSLVRLLLPHPFNEQQSRATRKGFIPHASSALYLLYTPRCQPFKLRARKKLFVVKSL